jgi:hypothetical protein
MTWRDRGESGTLLHSIAQSYRRRNLFVRVYLLQYENFRFS